MVYIKVTPQMVGTPLETIFRLLDASGMSLLAYKPVPLNVFLPEFLENIPRLRNFSDTNAGFLKVDEQGYLICWTVLETPDGSIAILSALSKSEEHFAGDFMRNYLEPVKGLKEIGYTFAIANQGEISDEYVAAQLQRAYI